MNTIEKLQREATELNKKLAAARKRSLLTCSSCKKRTSVSKLVYIQTHWYVQPYGCTGGDYWRAGEGRYECPKCGYENRLHDRPRATSLKYYFKEMVDDY